MQLDFYHALRDVLGICPSCGQAFRLSDIRISSNRATVPDLLDALREEEARLEKAERSIRDREKGLRAREVAKGRKLLPGLVRKAAPIVARLGFHPQEIKSIFHPVDLIVFDGLRSAKGEVERIVLLDAESDDPERRKLQRQVASAVESKEYHWETVRVNEDGGIETLRP